ncbi:hypothetical protein [Anaerosporobacter faecicola]|uniref:hypothetical protein n=1 Tax=Anaerosporobacter faecicola TaxID=2718714 RepID=UPI0014387F31|nr:hypothetical protein [Anaerosporobacter faecicola]
MSKTKIVIIQLKEIIYTAIFAGLGILLILLLIFMFLPDKKKGSDVEESAKYTAGVWTSELTIGETSLNIEVVVDESHINSVSITNLSETVTTMFPLLQPSLDDIASQLYETGDVDSVQLSENSKYTQTLLLDAIKTTLKKAEK